MSYQQDTKFVDDSVTANLASEFANFDWDVLILHYLGLDHVGHSAGPNSLLMPPKQREMDAIIKYILEQLIDKDKAGSLPTLFVVCSDHGMSEVGNHGGSSALETATVAVMMSSMFMNRTGYSGVASKLPPGLFVSVDSFGRSRYVKKVSKQSIIDD